MKNYYDILGLDNNCTKEEIKQAFRSLVKKTHPDNITEMSSEQKQKITTKFLEINTAYNILSDENKRAIYNQRYQNYLNNQKEQAKTKTPKNNKTFTKRHKATDKKLNRKQAEFSSAISFQIFRGTVHVCSEILFRTENLILKKEDNISKYLKRNLLTLATITLCSGVVFSANDASNKTKEESISQENTYTSIDEYYSNNIKLNRVHIIKAGDTLSQFAYDSGTTEESLSRINDIENGRIYYKDTIEIPYYVNRDDLNYYTDEVEYPGNNLSDFAKEYETDVETLEKLNEDKIIKVNDSYYSTSSNNLVVPRFTTKRELKTVKNNIQKVK